MAIYKEDIVSINLETGNIHRSFLNHSIGIGDSEANRFGVRVFRNGEAENLTGVSCFGYFRNAQGTNIALTNHGTVSGNVAFVTLPQACYAVEGQFTLAIKLVGGGITGTMRIVDGVVDNTNTGSPVAPTSDVPSYTEILAVYDQMQEALDEMDDIVKIFTPDPSGYSNKISKISETGAFRIGLNPSWIDLPEANFSGLIINFVYDPIAALQIAYRYGTNVRSIYYRTANPSTGEVYGLDWQRVDGYDNAHVGTLTASEYDGLLANVSAQIKTGFSNSTGWDDYPPGENAGIFIPIKYAENTMIQAFVSYPSMKAYVRVVQNQDAKTDWKAFGGGSNDVVYYAIGDSITAGSYSNDQGQGVVAKDVEWAYPNRIGRTYGCVVHNLGVPGAAITEFETQLALVGSDATIVTITGGANDYYLKDVPLGTHESAKGNTTVCGAIKNAIETVADTAPNARIILVSPFIIKYGSISTKWSMNYAGRAGFTYAQLADAMKDIAEDYNIEFIDGTRTGPTNILNIGDVQKDNVHPTKEFYKTIANWFGSKLF